MEKIFKKIGLSAGIAFAFMFATLLIVAQDKAVIPGNLEMKETAEINTRVSNMTTDSQMRMASPVSFNIELLAAPSQPENWTMTGSLSCESGSNLCGISFDEEEYELDENDKPNQDVLDAVNQHWSSTPHGEAIPNTNIFVHKRT